MSIGNVGNALIATYQYANRVQKSSTAEKTSFAETVKQTAESNSAARTDSYVEYLKQKYGNVTIKSIGKDQESLDRAGKSMSGNDVIIAPNIVEQMANDPEKATYYEQKIDYFFDTVIPRETAACAAKGIVFEPGGVIIHEDGSVTYVCGCSDPPERFAQARAEQKARWEKRAAIQEASLERSQEAADRRMELMELQNQKRFMAETLQKGGLDMGADFYFVNQPQVSAAVAAYESAVSTYSNSIIGGI